MRRRLWVGVIGLAAAVALSGTATASVSAKPLTKQQWIRKADKICENANKKLSAIAEEHFGDLGTDEDPSAEQLEAYAEEFLPEARSELSKIRKLRPPKADKATVKALLDTEAAALDAVEEDPQILLSEDPFAEARELAQDYGLKICGAESTD